MKAFIVTVRLALADRIAYRGETAAGVVASAARVLMAFVLWKAVAGEAGTAFGYSLPMAMTHYLFAALLPAIDQSDAYVWTFASEIRSGDFGKYLSRPVDPLAHFLAVSLGRSVFQALVCVGVMAASLGLDALLPGTFFRKPDPAGVVLAIPVAAAGLVCMSLVNYLTSLTAFRFQEITPWHMVKGNLVEVLSGAVVPLAVLPGWAERITALTPFPALADLPAALAMGSGRERLGPAAAVLAAWTGGLLLLAVACGKKAARGYAGAGG